MPRLARRLARRYLPHRVRAAGLALAGRQAAAPPGPRKAQAPRVAKAKAAARPAAEPGKAPAPLVEALRHGGGFVAGVNKQVRAMVADNDADGALALALALEADPSTTDVGRLAGGIVAGLRGYEELAWRDLAALPNDFVARWAPDEWVRAGLSQAPDDVRSRLSALADAADTELPAESWLALIGPVFGFGDEELARHLFARFDAIVGDGSAVSKGLVIQRDWLQRWVVQTPDGRSAPPVPAGRVSFAIMDYGHPSRTLASNNIGDHIQSIASLGHLVRHRGLRYHGPQDLVDLVTQLGDRARTELQRTDVDADVQLIQIDRDASAYAEIPPDTWTLGFGWFMHGIFDMRYGFPFHPNLQPIFVSFHCSRRALLTDEAIDYLRRFAPIGCRDWTTVDILLSIGVPAFFSGCLTTTVNTVFPEGQRAAADAPVGYVDVPADKVPEGGTTYAHQYDSVRFTTFADNVYDGIELLEKYRRTHSSLVTSRLHCYLPSRSIGIPVDFQPKNRSDPRFAGLIDITDAEFDRIRSTINERLLEVTSLILAGKPADEVYARWREINAPAVAAAEARRAEQRPVAAARSSLVADAARLRDTLSTDAPGRDTDTVHVAVRASADQGTAVRTLLRSIARHSSRPVHVHLVGRDLAELGDVAPRAGDGAPVTVSSVTTAGLGQDLRRGGGRRVPHRDVELLVLPEVLASVDRLVVLPADAVVLGDVAELADLDLAGELVAAPTVIGDRASSGFLVIHGASSRLRAKTRAAAELRRRAYARHAFDFDAFDVDVLVLDAAEYRRRSMVATYVPLIEEFGLSFRELLHFEVGPHRVVLDPSWHVVPSRSTTEHARLVHWADRAKPWTPDMAPGQQVWFDASA